MFTPCVQGTCLLKGAVIEDFQTLSVKCGKFTVRVGAKLCQSTFGQIFDDVCFTISKDLLNSSAGQIHGACNKHLSKLT